MKKTRSLKRTQTVFHLLPHAACLFSTRFFQGGSFCLLLKTTKIIQSLAKQGKLGVVDEFFMGEVWGNSLQKSFALNKEKTPPAKRYSSGFLFFLCDPAGARTRDPLLKRQMLYQLSYRIAFGTAKIIALS